MLSKSHILLLAAMLFVSGCGGDSAPQPAEQASGLNFNLPLRIRESLAINYDQVVGTVNINGFAEQMTRVSGTRYRADIEVPSNSDITLDVRFVERLPQGDLTLAETDQMQFNIGGSNLVIEIGEDEYRYDMDDDNDGISNIDERNNETDPFTPEVVPLRNFTVQFNLPQAINDPPEITSVIAIVNNSTWTPLKLGRFVSVSGVVPSNAVVEIDIRLTQDYQGERIQIAIAETDRPPGEVDLFVTLEDVNFDLSADRDNDGISNLDELQGGTNPLED